MFNYLWSVVRLTGSFILIGFFFEIELIFFVLGFLMMHIFLGLCVIIHDYTYMEKLKMMFLYLVRILLIVVLEFCIELFF